VLQAARSQLESLSSALELEVHSTLRTADVLLTVTAKELGPDPTDPLKRSSTTAVLAELTRGQPLVRAIRILSAHSPEASTNSWLPGTSPWRARMRSGQRVRASLTPGSSWASRSATPLLSPG
jgi:hypothetical protein